MLDGQWIIRVFARVINLADQQGITLKAVASQLRQPLPLMLYFSTKQRSQSQITGYGYSSERKKSKIFVQLRGEHFYQRLIPTFYALSKQLLPRLLVR